MANEYKITDIVDKQALEQVKDLKQRLAELKDEYVELAQELGKKLTLNVSTFTDLSKEAKEVNGIMERLSSTEREMAETAKQVNIINVKTAENIREVRRQVEGEERIKRERLKTEREESALATQLARQKKAEASANREVTVTEQQAEEALRREVKTIKEAQEANKVLRAYVKQLDTTTDEGKEKIKRYNEAINNNTKVIRENSDAMARQKMNVGNYTKSIKDAWEGMKSSFAEGDVRHIIASLGGGVSAAFTASLSGVAKLAGAFGLFSGVSTFFNAIKNGISTIVSFEKANSSLAAILGTNTKGITDLTKQARQLGATTSFTASQVTELQTELAKLGFTMREIQDATPDVLKFAKATGSNLADAASVAGAALRMFGADAGEMERYVSVMAVATTKSALSFSDLQSSLSTVGPVANAFGFTIEDTVTLLGKLKDSGFDASSAATATRNIFLNLADSNGKLAKSLGGPVTNMQELAEGLIRLRDRGVSLAEALELTDKRSVAAFESFLNVADSLVAMRKSVTDVEDDLEKMSETMGDNVSGSLNRLSSAWEGLMLTFSNSKGTMKSVIDFMAGLVDSIRYFFSDAEERQEMQNQEYIDSMEKTMQGVDGIVAQSRERLKREYADRVEIVRDAVNDEKSFIEAEQQIKSEELQRLVTEGDNANAELRRLYGEKKRIEEDMSSGNIGRQKYLYDEKQLETIGENISRVNAEIVKNARLQKMVKGLNLFDSFRMDNPDVKFAPKTGTDGKALTDKEKKELEQAAKERLKIQQALNESVVALMDDGLEKELAQIRNSYEKKMAQYTGNSEAEKQLRLNLSLKMSEEIEKKTLSHQLSEAEKTAKLRKEAATKGTEEYLQSEIQLLQINYRKQTELASVSAEERLLLFGKYEQEYTRLTEEYEQKRKDARMESITNSVSMASTLMTSRLEAELSALKQSYANGELDEEQYNREVADIKAKYAVNAAQASIECMEKVLEAEELTDEEREQLELRLAKLKMELSDKVAEREIQNNKRVQDSFRKQMEGAMQIVEFASQGVDGFSNLGSRLYQNQLDRLSGMSDQLQAAYDEEEARIAALEENGSISTEEAEARKRAAKDRTQKQNEQIARKQEEIERKQARLAKATAIAQAIMSTALAVMRVYADPGNGTFISRGVMAGIVSALGAIQLATIMATPISAYKEGTDDHKGGMAIVGDGGKREVIYYNGMAWLTPATSTMVDMPKHAKVFPDVESYESMRPMLSSDYLDMIGGSGEVKVVNDFTALQRAVESGNGMTAQQTELMKKMLRQSKHSEFMRYAANVV